MKNFNIINTLTPAEQFKFYELLLAQEGMALDEQDMKLEVASACDMTWVDRAAEVEKTWKNIQDDLDNDSLTLDLYGSYKVWAGLDMKKFLELCRLSCK